MQKKLIKWLKNKVKESGSKGIICGLSGGIDSAVAAVLAKRAFPKNSLFLFLPCNSNPHDRKHAFMLKRKFNLNLKEIDIEPVYNAFLKILKVKKASKLPKLLLANLKPRIRMIMLYFYANKFNYLVAGTGNRSELTVGYFTKYGDGGVDILPLGNLLKREVRKLAEDLNIPDEIIEKPPSAGLWENQTDEKEIGITYEELDCIIEALGRKRTPRVSGKKVEKVKRMNKSSAHKMKMPEIFTF
ncbi:MAG: NAD(+) synthase [Armatimonadota bacterium]